MLCIHLQHSRLALKRLKVLYSAKRGPGDSQLSFAHKIFDLLPSCAKLWVKMSRKIVNYHVLQGKKNRQIVL